MKSTSIFLVLNSILFNYALADLCLVNEHVQCGMTTPTCACVPCAASLSNAAGDNTTIGMDTHCGECAANYHADSTSGTGCTACSDGQDNPFGDPIGGANTTCADIECSLNYHVQNHVCEYCDPGYQNVAGDNAYSNVNTVCGECAENYYVSSGECKACAYLSDNAAGDVASGTDTFCDALSYEDHNAKVAQPHKTTTRTGKEVKDGSGTITLEFGQTDIFKFDFAILDTVTAKKNGQALTGGSLCYKAGFQNVGCGVGWHCSNNADTDSEACILHDGKWEQTARPTCNTFETAFNSIAAAVGASTADGTVDTSTPLATNPSAWRRAVTVAWCNDIPGASLEAPTLAQQGSDVTIYFEQNKCHIMKPNNGTVGTCDDIEQVLGTLDPSQICQYTCDTDYVLDRKTVCTAEKVLYPGTCTLKDGDGETGSDQTELDNDHLEDMNSDTQYSSVTDDGPFSGTGTGPGEGRSDVTSQNDLDGNGAKDNVPKCRFLPPNRIFPDNLVQGQEVNTAYDNTGAGDANDAVSAAADLQDQGTLTNEFFKDNTDTTYKQDQATIRMRFNADALTTDAENSYNYYWVHATSGNSINNQIMNAARKLGKLSQDQQLATVSIKPSGEKNTAGDDFFAMDSEETTVNPNECFYVDENNEHVQVCRPTATIKFWKRYQVVIGASSLCAGSVWSDKEHMFIRATYTVDSEFEIKYAPGLNLRESGFNELSPGIWVMNRISAQQPTLLMHSDYSKSIVNVARASATVTHASLHAFTRLELIGATGLGSDQAHTTDDESSAGGHGGESTQNSGHDVDQDEGSTNGGDHDPDPISKTTDSTNQNAGFNTSEGGSGSNVARRRLSDGFHHPNTGMCRDSHAAFSNVSGFNDDTGADDDESSDDSGTSTCLFRARMVVEQQEDDNHLNKANLASTLAGYYLDLSMAQFAQFNFEVLSSTGIVELKELSQRPADFGKEISTPSIANQNNVSHAAFGSDVRFDICACNMRYRHTVAGGNDGATSVSNFIGTNDAGSGVPASESKDTGDVCSHNEKLDAFLKEKRADDRGLVNGAGAGGSTGFISAGLAAPATLAAAHFSPQNTPASVDAGYTYTKKYAHEANLAGGIAAACTYEAFFPPDINTPFAYIRAWFRFREGTHVDQVTPYSAGKSYADIATDGEKEDINTNARQWSPGTQSGNDDNSADHHSTYPSDEGYSGEDVAAGPGEPDATARRLRSTRILATKPAPKAPPNFQHSVHFKFK